MNLFNHKDKYLYDNYFSCFDGAKIKTIPTVPYNPITATEPVVADTYCVPQRQAESFINAFQNNTGSSSIDDIFQQKLSLTQDRTSLILNDIIQKDALHKQNLARLYDDLFMVEKWRTQRPYPENHLKDKTWIELNKMELQIRDQIRREIKESVKSTAFNEKDLRESLLDFKKQSQKTQALGTMLEDEISNQYEQKEVNQLYNIAGDTYRL